MKKWIKITFTGLLAVVAVMNSNAQQNWLQCAGGNANDEALGVTHDASGNVYSCGYFSQTCRFDSTYIISAGMADLFVAKQDSLGYYEWVVRAGGANSDRAHAIAADASGNIIVTGVFRDTAVFGSTTLVSLSNSQDIFVAKIDNNGNFVWAKSFGGSNTDISNKIAVDASGNIIVAGEFKGTSSYGAFTFSSAVYPPLMQQQAGQPSYDAIIFKCDPSGNVLWAKAGIAPFDDRAVSVAVDETNNIYVCGQYSDTIQFTNTYNNNSFNAGFIMKIDPSGNESWFRRMVASQFMAYDIDAKINKVVVTGDFSNTLTINTTPSQSVTGNFPHNIFTLCLDYSGNYQWGSSTGSDNVVSSRALFIDPDGETTITGYFKCEFTPFSNYSGSGVFNSTGFRDIYTMKYSATGAFTWIRYFGGTGDDIPSDISGFIFSNPVISGTFSKSFNIFKGSNFQSHLYNPNYTNLNSNITHCSYPNYGSTATVISSGNRDVLITRPVDLSRPYYDFFIRQNGGCQLDTLMPTRYPLGDTLVKCDSALLRIQTPTTLDSVSAPEWFFVWNNGVMNDTNVVYTSGWYYVDYGYIDECRTFRDSVYVLIYPTPPTPAINATYGIIQAAIPVYSCIDKLALMAGDTTTLIGGNYPSGYTVYWQTPFGMVNNDSVTTSQFGLYTFVVETPGGECSSSKCVALYDYYSGNCNVLNPFTPQIIFTDSTFETTDTVRICKDDHFEMWLVDSSYYAQGITTNIATFVQWTINFGGYSFDPNLSFPYTFFEHRQNFKANSSGNCSLTATILHPITHLPLVSTTRYFYLDVHAPPPNFPVISGPVYFCPGDTVTLSVSGGDNYQWNGQGIIATYNQNTNADVVMQNTYGVTSTTIDTVLGCISVEEDYFTLQSMPAPEVTMNPSHGVVCPLDSVLLTAEAGSNYTWYGPTGNVIGTTQSIYVTVPGFYHYTYISSTGCYLESSSSEVLEYTTPYLEYDPVSHLCEGESTVITVESNDMASIQWLSPLSGSSPVQTITQGGTYSATVNFCNITTQVDIVITASTTPVEIYIVGEDTVCAGDTVNLLATPGMSDYNWNNGENFSMNYDITYPGTYILETIDANGCESTDTAFIYNFPQVTPPSTSDTTVCSGSTITLTAQGTGTLYWYSDENATQLIQTGDSVTVTVSQSDYVVYVTQSNGICESETVGVIVYIDSSSVVPELSGNDTLCMSDTLTLVLNAAPGAMYNWTGPNGFSSTGDSISIYPVTGAEEGYYFISVSSGTCSGSTDSVWVEVMEVTVQGFAQDSVFICQGDTLLLNADTLNGTYTWQDGNTGATSLGIQQGNYFYTFENSYGCTAYSDTLTLQWLSKPVLTPVADTSSCPGTPFSIGISGSNGIIQWMDSSMNVITSGDSLYFPEITSDTYVIVQLTDTNGCESDVDTIFIALTSLLPAPMADASDTICAGSSLQLFTTTANGFTYNWSGPNGFTSSLEDPIISPVDSSMAGTYFLFINQGTCYSDTATLDISVNNLPSLVSSNDTGICAGSTVLLYAYSPDGIIWNTGDVSNSISVSPGVSTTYTVSTGNVCGTLTDSITVIIFPSSGFGAGPDITIVYGNHGQLTTTGGTSWEWSPADGLNCTTCANPLASPEETTTYGVTITDQNGCTSSDSVTVWVEYNFNYFVPNTFTPNGDGINDIFYIRGYGVESMEVKVFDRWGEMIFHSSDINAGWDGTYKGKPLSNGVFVYTLGGKLLDGREFREKGAITLVK